ncbi:MAG: hypothetical protein Ct9H90mP27_4870 [Gammaproteobacteria bacterium]|nr:MAG: hypothetical protein Ct9H90mP27_4870 [Gammaproteobacteria bacterium]
MDQVDEWDHKGRELDESLFERLLQDDLVDNDFEHPRKKQRRDDCDSGEKTFPGEELFYTGKGSLRDRARRPKVSSGFRSVSRSTRS